VASQIIEVVMRPLLVASISTLVLLASCSDGERGLGELTEQEITHIRSLGLLDSGEVVLQLHSNGTGRNPVMQAGNFYTERRIARYWMEKDPNENKIKTVWLAEVDTLIPHFNNAWPASSFIEVRTGPHSWFNLYVNGEGRDAMANTFYEGLMAQWKNVRKTKAANEEHHN